MPGTLLAEQRAGVGSVMHPHRVEEALRFLRSAQNLVEPLITSSSFIHVLLFLDPTYVDFIADIEPPRF